MPRRRIRRLVPPPASPNQGTLFNGKQTGARSEAARAAKPPVSGAARAGCAIRTPPRTLAADLKPPIGLPPRSPAGGLAPSPTLAGG